MGNIERRYTVREGFEFERGEDGSVTVRVKVGSAQATHMVVIPLNEWASVIASMCARGEDGDTYQDAVDFHTVVDVPLRDVGLVRGRIPGEQ